MNKQQAIEICENMGWDVTEISKGYLLESVEDKVTFNSTKELIKYAKELKRDSGE